jgi:putative ABC transport system permease protein
MFSLALRNLLRQKSRTAITALAICAGVIALILTGGFVQDIFSQLGEAFIHSRSGHLQIYRQGFYEAGSRSPEKYLIDNPEALRRSIGRGTGQGCAPRQLPQNHPGSPAQE